MTIVLIFLGWFILSSLWGFLPVVEPLRQFAISGLMRRRIISGLSGAFALLTGILLLAWVSSYSAVILTSYDAHTVSDVPQTQATGSVFLVTNQVMLQQFVPGFGCQSQDAAVCAMAAQAAQPGQMAGMLPVIGLSALFPALAAAFVCWKLTAPPAIASE